MGAGKVDYDNLWKNQQQRDKRIRWRTLRSQQTGGLVAIYGYSVSTQPEGPWFGYTLADLESAPCVHCGQTGVFRPQSWVHECPGIYQGHRLPCSQGIALVNAAHMCRGEPSMSYAGPAYDAGDGLSARATGGPSLWRSEHWHELEVLGG